MPSKAKAERRTKTKLPLEVDYTKQFSEDWTKLEHSGKCNMERPKALMMKPIASEGPLDAIHLEHELTGTWAGFHECHMGGDVLLIYQKSELRIIFNRAGSHAALFEN